MQKDHSRCAEGCAEGLSVKRSFKVRGGVRREVRGGVRRGSECKKVIQGAQRGAWRV